MAEWVRVCALEELEPDTPRRYRVNEQDIFVVRHKEQVYAIADRCGHMCAPLHRGDFTDGLIVCGLHGAAFRVDSGEVEWEAVIPPPFAQYSSNPNPRLRTFGELIEAVETLPVLAFPVTVENNQVFIEVDSCE